MASRNNSKSSRLCVMQIPAYITEARLKEHFTQKGGQVTDVRILGVKRGGGAKNNKPTAGSSRRIAFIGFRDEAQAQTALNYFNGTYLDTAKLIISFALPVNDPSLVNNKKRKRSLSSSTSTPAAAASASADAIPEKSVVIVNAKDATKKNPKLKEFLELMKPRQKSQFWANDGGAVADDDDEDDDKEEEEAIVEEQPTKKSAKITAPTTTTSTSSSASFEKRLFIRNLAFSCQEEDLRKLFEPKYGSLEEVLIPRDGSNQSTGFGFVTFSNAEKCISAMNDLNGSIFQGRLIQLLPALGKKKSSATSSAAAAEKGIPPSSSSSNYKEQKEKELKKNAKNENIWSSLFVRADAATEAVASRLNISKSEYLFGGGGRENGADHAAAGEDSAAVKAALAETSIIAETKEFLVKEGVDLTVLEAWISGDASAAKVEKSKTVILVKNLPPNANPEELEEMFKNATSNKNDSVEKFVMPPSKVMALVSFYTAEDCSKAFRALAYKRYRRIPLYLEMAPERVMIVQKQQQKNAASSSSSSASAKSTTASSTIDNMVQSLLGFPGATDDSVAVANTTDEALDDFTLFVTNLDFSVTEQNLQKHCETLLRNSKLIRSVRIPQVKSNSSTSSSGYGFVEFVNHEAAKRARRLLDESTLQGKLIKVDFSQTKPKASSSGSSSTTSTQNKKKSANVLVDASMTKLLVKNLAFETSRKELKSLFEAHARVKSIRMPKKPMSNDHRGFAFVDFLTHDEAQVALNSLSRTHLYGRHLVIEWAKPEQTVAALRESAAKASSS